MTSLWGGNPIFPLFWGKSHITREKSQIVREIPHLVSKIGWVGGCLWQKSAKNQKVPGVLFAVDGWVGGSLSWEIKIFRKYPPKVHKVFSKSTKPPLVSKDSKEMVVPARWERGFFDRFIRPGDTLEITFHVVVNVEVLRSCWFHTF